MRPRVGDAEHDRPSVEGTDYCAVRELEQRLGTVDDGDDAAAQSHTGMPLGEPLGRAVQGHGAGVALAFS